MQVWHEQNGLNCMFVCFALTELVRTSNCLSMFLRGGNFCPYDQYVCYRGHRGELQGVLLVDSDLNRMSRFRSRWSAM